MTPPLPMNPSYQNIYNISLKVKKKLHFEQLLFSFYAFVVLPNNRGNTFSLVAGIFIVISTAIFLIFVIVSSVLIILLRHLYRTDISLKLTVNTTNIIIHITLF